MKWRHMESKQRREQERASSAAAASATRSSCISLPPSIASRQIQPLVSPSTKPIPDVVNASDSVNSDVPKASSMPHLGILKLILSYFDS